MRANEQRYIEVNEMDKMEIFKKAAIKLNELREDSQKWNEFIKQSKEDDCVILDLGDCLWLCYNSHFNYGVVTMAESEIEAMTEIDAGHTYARFTIRDKAPGYYGSKEHHTILPESKGSYVPPIMSQTLTQSMDDVKKTWHWMSESKNKDILFRTIM